MKLSFLLNVKIDSFSCRLSYLEAEEERERILGGAAARQFGGFPSLRYTLWDHTSVNSLDRNDIGTYYETSIRKVLIEGFEVFYTFSKSVYGVLSFRNG